MHTKTKGFTLIELLVVIAIIGVLATIILIGLQGARQKARDAVRLSDVHEMAKALEMQYDTVGHYPITATTTDCTTPGNWIPDGSNYQWSAPYIAKQPRDPAEQCGGATPRTYSYQSDGQSYHIGVQLEGTVDPSTHRGQEVSFDGTSFQKSATQFTVAFSSPAGSLTNSSPIPITVTFSAPAADFTQSSLTAQNSSLISDFVELLDTVFTFLVTPRSNGTVVVGVSAGAVHDQEGDANNASSISVTYDSQLPHVALSPDPLPASVSGPFVVQASFTLPVNGFTAGDVAVLNGSVSNFNTLSGTSYSFTVTPAASGQVSVSVPAGAAQTDAGNGNVGSNTLTTSF